MIRNVLREAFYDVDEASVNNKPLAGEPYEIHDPDTHEFDSVVDLDSEIKVGIKDTKHHIFLYLIHTEVYNDPDPKVIGHMDLLHNDVAPYPIAKMIRIHPDYQGKGYGKMLYEWIINTYGGLVSDSTLTKRGGKGSFHIWRSLHDDGYEISVVRWSDVENMNVWEPQKVKSIDNWVKIGKGGFRLVVTNN